MKALIIGAGAQGRVILDILRAAGRHEYIGFVDENPRLWGQEIGGARVAGGLDSVLENGTADLEMIVALGDPAVRLRVADRLQRAAVPLLNAIHPSAVVMPSARLGLGNMLGATAVVNSGAEVGDNVIINTGAVVEHDCLVANGAAVGPGAHLGGRVKLGKSAFIATGAIVLSRVSVGSMTVVGAGAVVTRDLPDRVLALGVPARVVECLDGSFDWSRVL